MEVVFISGCISMGEMEKFYKEDHGEWLRLPHDKYKMLPITARWAPGCPLATSWARGQGFRNLEICRLIIDNVQEKNPVCNDGETPLHRAARYGRLEI